MVFVSTHHEVDAELVEQRHPFFADPEVRAIELVNRRDGDLMHAHDDPVDIRIPASGGQLLFQPGLLSAGRIAPNIGVPLSWYATSSLAMLSTRTEPAVKAYHSPRVTSVWPAASGTEK